MPEFTVGFEEPNLFDITFDFQLVLAGLLTIVKHYGRWDLVASGLVTPPEGPLWTSQCPSSRHRGKSRQLFNPPASKLRKCYSDIF